MDLADATALVTGSSRGIGASIARRLAARGAHVVLHGRDGARLDSAAADLGSKAIAVDLLAPDGAAELAERCGPVDLLVHCAGVGWHGSLTSMPVCDMQRLIAVNLAAAITLTHELLPAMLAQAKGHLTFVGSIAGLAGVADEAVYSATKAGLLTFADSLRLELHGTPIGVSTVSPAAVDTDFWARLGIVYRRRVPRMVSPDRIARDVVADIEQGRPNRVAPRWLAAAPAVHGVAPGLYHLLAARFG